MICVPIFINILNPSSTPTKHSGTIVTTALYMQWVLVFWRADQRSPPPNDLVGYRSGLVVRNRVPIRRVKREGLVLVRGGRVMEELLRVELVR